jgi:hypothetical protein
MQGGMQIPANLLFVIKDATYDTDAYFICIKVSRVED